MTATEFGPELKGTLLNVKSHRARERLSRLLAQQGESYTEWVVIRENYRHVYEVPNGLVDAALKIKSISRARLKNSSVLSRPWS